MLDILLLRTERPLLCAVTGEPCQPARLYYEMPSKPFVTRLLAQLRCMAEDVEGGRWV